MHRRPRTRPGGAATDPASRWLFALALALAVLPIAVATGRAVADGWLAVGDNAYFAIRAADVLTEHHPLLGTWTSASLSAGTNFNNPGPLLFDLLALPVKVDPDAGLAVGVGLLNALATAGVGLVARRVGGHVVGVLALAMATAIGWTMGSELLFDPWQPHSLVLPFLLLTVLAWGLASGWPWALPLTIAVASVLVQTHLSYAVLVALLGLWGVIGAVLAARRRGAVDRRGQGWRRPLAVAGVVLVACWAQPVAEQLTASDEGNLSRIATDAGGSPESLGATTSARLVASVVVAPPWWLRPSFAQTVPPSATGFGVGSPQLRSAGAAVPLLVGLAVALAAVAAIAVRRRDHVTTALVGTASAAVVAALVSVAILPRTGFGLAAHQVRWLWPVGALTTFTFVVAAVRLLPGALLRGRLAVVAAAALVAVLCVANLPEQVVPAGPTADRGAIPVVRELREAMAVLEGGGPYVIAMEGIRFAEPFSGPVMAELQRRGIPFVADDEGMVRQLGPARRAAGGEARLLVRDGAGSLDPPDGSELAVLVAGLDEAEQGELDRLDSAVSGHLAALGEVPLNDQGRRAVERGDLPAVREQPELLVESPERFVDFAELVYLVEEDLLDLEPGWREQFERWATLTRRFRDGTVALFVVPATGAEAG